MEGRNTNENGERRGSEDGMIQRGQNVQRTGRGKKKIRGRCQDAAAALAPCLPVAIFGVEQSLGKVGGRW